MHIEYHLRKTLVLDESKTDIAQDIKNPSEYFKFKAVNSLDGKALYDITRAH
jgi:hypothetical protein